MRINNINSTNFNGMWAPVKVLKTETGVYHYNKKMFTIYDMVYHPWMNEQVQQVSGTIKQQEPFH